MALSRSVAGAPTRHDDLPPTRANHPGASLSHREMSRIRRPLLALVATGLMVASLAAFQPGPVSTWANDPSSAGHRVLVILAAGNIPKDVAAVRQFDRDVPSRQPAPIRLSTLFAAILGAGLTVSIRVRLRRQQPARTGLEAAWALGAPARAPPSASSG